MTVQKRKYAVLAVLFFGCVCTAVTAQKKVNIGVTLHPYYSFVKNIVKDAADVTPLIDSAMNPEHYTPMPEDIKKIESLDCMVVNGLGHDTFAFDLMNASSKKDTLPLIYANEEVSLIPVSDYNSVERTVNTHTFISVQDSVQQIYTISKHLQQLDPQNALYYRKNTQEYARKLRDLRSAFMKRIAGIRSSSFLYATLHDGYDYLLQEFGLRVSAVMEYANGLQPTPAQVKEIIDTIKKLHIDILFTEKAYTASVMETIVHATGVTVAELSHLTAGPYTDENFEKGLTQNLENLTNAIITVHNKNMGSPLP